MNSVARAIVEAGFIILLFYSNLLMGEYERSGSAQTRGFLWAIQDIFSTQNFLIAIAASLIGYLLVEFLRKKLL
jgi:hypothetical protein